MTNNKMIKAEDMHTQKTVYNAKRYLPEIRVSFHTASKCYQAVGRNLARGEIRDPTYQLLSVSTSKTLASAVGGLTITLAGDQWASRITSNDLIVISMGYVGEAMNTAMIGLVDTVKTKRSAQGGTPLVTTTVVGRDFGKLFVKTQLKFYPEIGAKTTDQAKKFFLTSAGKISLMKVFTGSDMVEGTPAVILKKIMTEIFLKLNNTRWSVYDETKTTPTAKTVGASNIIGWVFEKTNFFLPFMLSADAFEGALWNLMERAVQKPFTELFIDTRDASEGFSSEGGAGIVVRTVEQANSQKSTVTTTTTVANKPKDTYHTVVKGNTLWALAGRYYGNNYEWRKIWEANKTMMIARDKRNATNHGHWIYPGQKLLIPGKATSGGTTTKTTTTQAYDTAYPPTTQTFGYDRAKVVLTYRTTPYDSVDRKKLYTHTLYAIDVLDEDLTVGDEKHYNLFWAGSTINPLGDLNIKSIIPPLINEKDILRYGISPLEVQFEGLAIDRAKASNHQVALENLTGKYTSTLKAWFEKNHTYAEGTLTVRGKGNYRVGQRLIYADIKKEFYIEGVSQSFNVYTEWTTTLTVSRGMPTDAVINSDAYGRTTEKPPVAKPATKPVAKTYTVKKGDTLWAIAGRYYGNSLQWRKIWEANKTMLIARDKRNASDHGHWIYPGQKLTIPA